MQKLVDEQETAVSDPPRGPAAFGDDWVAQRGPEGSGTGRVDPGPPGRCSSSADPEWPRVGGGAEVAPRAMTRGCAPRLPTAAHEIGVHDTACSEEFSAGVGVGSMVQVLPLDTTAHGVGGSANTSPCPVPTAVQDVRVVQETPVRRLCQVPAGVPIRWADQRRPLIASINARG
jgi:hypothetical protein